MASKSTNIFLQRQFLDPTDQRLIEAVKIFTPKLDQANAPLEISAAIDDVTKIPPELDDQFYDEAREIARQQSKGSKIDVQIWQKLYDDRRRDWLERNKSPVEAKALDTVRDIAKVGGYSSIDTDLPTDDQKYNYRAQNFAKLNAAQAASWYLKNFSNKLTPAQVFALQEVAVNPKSGQDAILALQTEHPDVAAEILGKMSQRNYVHPGEGWAQSFNKIFQVPVGVASSLIRSKVEGRSPGLAGQRAMLTAKQIWNDGASQDEPGNWAAEQRNKVTREVFNEYFAQHNRYPTIGELEGLASDRMKERYGTAAEWFTNRYGAPMVQMAAEMALPIGTATKAVVKTVPGLERGMKYIEGVLNPGKPTAYEDITNVPGGRQAANELELIRRSGSQFDEVTFPGQEEIKAPIEALAKITEKLHPRQVQEIYDITTREGRYAKQAPTFADYARVAGTTNLADVQNLIKHTEAAREAAKHMDTLRTAASADKVVNEQGILTKYTEPHYIPRTEVDEAIGPQLPTDPNVKKKPYTHFNPIAPGSMAREADKAAERYTRNAALAFAKRADEYISLGKTNKRFKEVFDIGSETGVIRKATPKDKIPDGFQRYDATYFKNPKHKNTWQEDVYKRFVHIMGKEGEAVKNIALDAPPAMMEHLASAAEKGWFGPPKAPAKTNVEMFLGVANDLQRMDNELNFYTSIAFLKQNIDSLPAITSMAVGTKALNPSIQKMAIAATAIASLPKGKAPAALMNATRKVGNTTITAAELAEALKKAGMVMDNAAIDPSLLAEKGIPGPSNILAKGTKAAREGVQNVMNYSPIKQGNKVIDNYTRALTFTSVLKGKTNRDIAEAMFKTDDILGSMHNMSANEQAALNVFQPYQIFFRSMSRLLSKTLRENPRRAFFLPMVYKTTYEMSKRDAPYDAETRPSWMRGREIWVTPADIEGLDPQLKALREGSEDYKVTVGETGFSFLTPFYDIVKHVATQEGWEDDKPRLAEATGKAAQMFIEFSTGRRLRDNTPITGPEAVARGIIPGVRVSEAFHKAIRYHAEANDWEGLAKIFGGIYATETPEALEEAVKRFEGRSAPYGQSYYIEPNLQLSREKGKLFQGINELDRDVKDATK